MEEIGSIVFWCLLWRSNKAGRTVATFLFQWIQTVHFPFWSGVWKGYGDAPSFSYHLIWIKPLQTNFLIIIIDIQHGGWKVKLLFLLEQKLENKRLLKKMHVHLLDLWFQTLSTCVVKVTDCFCLCSACISCVRDFSFVIYHNRLSQCGNMPPYKSRDCVVAAVEE